MSIRGTLLKLITNIYRGLVSPQLTSAIIGVTYRCNAHCPHCSQSDIENEKRVAHELTQEEWESVFVELKKMGVSWVNLFGGEPLLRKDLQGIIRAGTDKKFSMCFETNAYLLDEAMISELKSSGLQAVIIGLDYAEAQQQDEFKGLPGSWEKAIQAIGHCKKYDLTCCLSVTATKQKIENNQIRPVLELAKKLKLDQVRVMIPVMVGKWKNTRAVKFSKDEYEELKKIAGEYKKLVFLNCHDKQDRINCRPLSRNSIFINAFGEVMPCCLVPVIFGNVREEKLASILKRMWRHEMFRACRGTCWVLDDYYYSEYILPNYMKRLT